MFQFILSFFRKRKLNKLLETVEMCAKCTIRPVFKGQGNRQPECKNYHLHGNCKGAIIKRNDPCFCGSGKKYKVCCDNL